MLEVGSAPRVVRGQKRLRQSPTSRMVPPGVVCPPASITTTMKAMGAKRAMREVREIGDFILAVSEYRWIAVLYEGYG